MAGSRNYDAYDPESGAQVGYARVITDRVTFGWLCDVFVDPDLRGAGVGSALMSGIIDDLAPLSLKRTALFTEDAHGLYERFGFEPLSPTRAGGCSAGAPGSVRNRSSDAGAFGAPSAIGTPLQLQHRKPR